jgi:glycolate oxidase FAD binding subunit
MATETRPAIAGVTTVLAEPAILQRYQVDGLTPELVAVPAAEAEVAAALQVASGLGLAVAPRGGGTKLGLGNIPERLDAVLSLERLNQVVEYVPADLTCTVQAGMTLADLQALVRQHGQTFPLDPAHGARATIAGIVATASSGPRRMAFGSVRDLLLGTHLALPDGRLIKTGGRVVKNVAGYDMNKLVAGSLGTLGIITEVTVKLRPLPEATATCRFAFPDLTAALAAAEAVLNAEVLPTAVTVLSPGPAARLGAPGPVTLAIALEESAPNVAYQARRLPDLVRAEGDSLTGAPEAAFWTAVCDWEAPICMKVNTVISELDRLLGRMLSARTAGADGADAIIHVGSGTALLYAGADLPVATLEDWFEAAGETGGSAVLQQAPLAIKRLLDVWGPRRPEWTLAEAVKRSLDPARTLNRGRFVGGM